MLVGDHAWSKKIVEEAVKVAKFFKNHTFTAAEIRRRSTEASGKAIAVILHGQTRIAGLYYVLKRLEDLRGYMREICVSDGWDERYAPVHLPKKPAP